jgi:hypothetical protein
VLAAKAAEFELMKSNPPENVQQRMREFEGKISALVRAQGELSQARYHREKLELSEEAETNHEELEKANKMESTAHQNVRMMERKLVEEGLELLKLESLGWPEVRARIKLERKAPQILRLLAGADSNINQSKISSAWKQREVVKVLSGGLHRVEVVRIEGYECVAKEYVLEDQRQMKQFKNEVSQLCLVHNRS